MLADQRGAAITAHRFENGYFAQFGDFLRDELSAIKVSWNGCVVSVNYPFPGFMSVRDYTQHELFEAGLRDVFPLRNVLNIDKRM